MNNDWVQSNIELTVYVSFKIVQGGRICNEDVYLFHLFFSVVFFVKVR